VTDVRIGNGFDVHALVAGRRLVLGGVAIPHARGLDGHSDADVLLHAVCDALLGALALGDIGRHFPDTDARWKDADSRTLLRHVVSLVTAEALACRQSRRHRHRAGAEDRAARARDACEPRGRPRVRHRRRGQGNDHRGPRLRGRGEGIAALASVVVLRESRRDPERADH
jgi:2-C-methyl-D-erythritol 2,4-cyclodiphosphate synthase